MYIKEEIEITQEDMVIIEKLGELLCLSAIDDYFYVHDQDLFVQLKVFTDKFEEAYDKGFGRYFSDKHFYRWVRSNVIKKFTGLLEALFKGLLLEQFNEDANGVLTYKNCIAYRTYHIVTQSEEQAEVTEVTSRILTLEEAHAYAHDMLEIEDNLIQALECFHIKVEQQQEKVDSKNKKKESREEIRVLVYKRMCDLLTKNFQRANCVEEIQYRLILGTLIGTVDKSFTPSWKKENYESYEVAKQVRVNMRSEFNYFQALYKDLVHYKKSLIKMEF